MIKFKLIIAMNISVASLLVDILRSILGFIFGVTQKQKKSLHYAISETPVVSVNEKIEGITITYLNKPVENLRVALVKIRNSGNMPILEKDFVTPISFGPARTARGNFLAVGDIIFAPESSNPELFNYVVGHHSERLALKNMTLNAKDFILIKIIIADYGGENIPVNVTGRIVGVREFKQEPLVLDNRNVIAKLLFEPPEKSQIKNLLKKKY